MSSLYVALFSNKLCLRFMFKLIFWTLLLIFPSGINVYKSALGLFDSQYFNLNLNKVPLLWLIWSNSYPSGIGLASLKSSSLTLVILSIVICSSFSFVLACHSLSFNFSSSIFFIFLIVFSAVFWSNLAWWFWACFKRENFLSGCSENLIHLSSLGSESIQ